MTEATDMHTLRGRPFPRVIVCDREMAEQHGCGLADVCISIRSPGGPVPRLGPFADVLSLVFHDDQWPGWESRGTLLTDAEADAVIAFVDRWRDDARRLVIHCEAGISRSVSLAMAIGALYLVRIDFGWKDRSDRYREAIPNPGVFTRVCAAYARSRATCRGEVADALDLAIAAAVAVPNEPAEPAPPEERSP